MEPNQNNGLILNFRTAKSSLHCRVCGTGRYRGESWNDLCHRCAAWRDARHFSLLMRRALREAR
jgi:hypothetical protein